MSDDEYEFEYSDEDQNNEDDIAVDIQNEFYTAKGLLHTDDAAALNGFHAVITKVDGSDKADELAEWRFKALKNIVKTRIRRGETNEMLESYQTLLEAINSGAVGRNRAEKAVNKILDLVSSSSNTTLIPFYSKTLDALQRSGGNDTIVFKTKMKLANLYLMQHEWRLLGDLIADLQATLDRRTLETGGDDRGKATQLLEIYALQIQMYTILSDTKRLRDVHKRAITVSKGAVPTPGITGVMFECGGKLHMAEREWESARLQFMEAFKAYEEAGQTDKTLQALKYMLLANMLSSSRINPFDSQEAKAYEKDPYITGMTQLTDAYLAKDISVFEPVLRKYAHSFESDDFMRPYIHDLIFSMRTQVLIGLVAPYTRLKFSFLAAELGITETEVEELLVTLIRDEQLHATVDQVAGVLMMEKGASLAAKPGDASGHAATDEFTAVEHLASKLSQLAKVLPTFQRV